MPPDREPQPGLGWRAKAAAHHDAQGLLKSFISPVQTFLFSATCSAINHCILPQHRCSENWHLDVRKLWLIKYMMFSNMFGHTLGNAALQITLLGTHVYVHTLEDGNYTFKTPLGCPGWENRNSAGCRSGIFFEHMRPWFWIITHMCRPI